VFPASQPQIIFRYVPDKQQNKPQEVITYPLGVGREGWNTPYIDTRIVQKKKHPYWYPPKSIRKEHQEKGDPLPKRVGPGPENPLGDYALRLGVPQYLIHGTNKPYGIGMRISHGCIRLYPEHIEKLFEVVKLGTPVHIVNQPYKVGQRDGKIFLEAHPFLEEDADLFKDNLTSVVKMLIAVTAEHTYEVDWVLAKQVINEFKGVPVEIGKFTVDSFYSDSGTAQNDAKESKMDGLELRLETKLLNKIQ